MSDKKSSLIIERAQVRSMEGAKKGDERKKEEGLAVAEEGSPAEVEDGARLLLHMVSAASSVTWASDMVGPYDGFISSIIVLVLEIVSTSTFCLMQRRFFVLRRR